MIICFKSILGNLKSTVLAIFFSCVHQNGEFQCAVCQKLFSNKTTLERHIKTMHGTDHYTCPQCGAKCPDKGTLARHMYTHTGKLEHFQL